MILWLQLNAVEFHHASALEDVGEISPVWKGSYKWIGLDDFRKIHERIRNDRTNG